MVDLLSERYLKVYDAMASFPKGYIALAHLASSLMRSASPSLANDVSVQSTVRADRVGHHLLCVVRYRSTF
jgi:hypothetical protein